MSLSVRRYTSEEDRQAFTKSDWLQLSFEGKDGKPKSFAGVALFKADPADLKDKAYLEFGEHKISQEPFRTMPCPGPDDCPFCQEGFDLMTRALTVWQVDDEIKLFRFNYNLIKIFTDFRSENIPILGREFRVSLIDGRGNYNIIQRQGNISASAVKVITGAEDFPDLEKILTRQMRKAMDELNLTAGTSAMEDEPQDEPDEKPVAARKGKPAAAAAKGKAKPKQELAEWPAEADDLEVTVEEVDGNTVTVSNPEYEGMALLYGTNAVDVAEVEPGSVGVATWVTDEDDDFVLVSFEAQEAVEPETDEDEVPDSVLPDRMEAEVVTVESVDASEETIDVVHEEYGSFTLYFLDSTPIDVTDYAEGEQVTITAYKDETGDMVAEAVPAKPKAAGKKKAAAATPTARKRK